MLSGCQYASIENMVTERHNIASRLIIKTLNKKVFHPGSRLVRFSQLGFCKDQDIWVVGGNSMPQIPMTFEEASDIQSHDFEFC